MSQLLPFDFELVVFKFENSFFTTKSLFHKLLENVKIDKIYLYQELITTNLKEAKSMQYKKNEREQIVEFNHALPYIVSLKSICRQNGRIYFEERNAQEN